MQKTFDGFRLFDVIIILAITIYFISNLVNEWRTQSEWETFIKVAAVLHLNLSFISTI